MKRDLDLVRRLLLKIEERHNIASSDLACDELISASHELVSYHLQMMIQEAGLAKGISIPDMDEDARDGWEDIELTWKGHDFLDQVRDDEIWRLTKEGVTKAKGFSFDLLASLAKGLAREKIKKHTGIEIDI